MCAATLAASISTLLLISGCSKQSPQVSPPQTTPAQKPAAAQSVASGSAMTSLAAPATLRPIAQTQPPAQSQTPRLITSEQTQGPFRIGEQSFTFVKHLQRIEGSKSPDDVTVDWWELRDASGNPVFRQDYPPRFQDGAFEETMDVSARETKTQYGHGILVDGGWLPSAPNSGWWVQLFGLFNGKLVSFGEPISTDGDYLGEAVLTYEPTAIFRGQTVQPVSHDVLRFKEWTGNFFIIYDVIIDWMQAKARPAWTCQQMTSPGPGSACRYKVEAEPVRGKDLTFVRLFAEPDAGFTPKHVVIKPESNIEYIEAQVPVVWTTTENNASFGVSISHSAPGSEMWLHIKVDGQDGWISGEEDFEAIGLPQAG
jgi:hypothetical protein